MKDFASIQKQFELNVFPKKEITLIKGKDSKVWDSEGREYIDCIGGNGIASIGHCNDHLTESLTRQLKTLTTCPGSFYNDTKALFLEKLISLFPPSLNRAYLTNSGTESIETAIKFARLVTGKKNFVCAIKGFHGRTMGALSATYKPEYKEGFEPFLPGFSHVSFNNSEALKAQIDDNTAAVILEMVQGEGGINIGKKEYFKEVKDLCEEKGILFIADEVQSGFCRTGKMFAFEHFDFEPDILCLAKAIGGSFPMGAVVCNEKIKIPIGKHGTTFGGSPLACSAGLASLEFMIENKLDIQSKEKGEYFREKFLSKKLNKVVEMRNLGLMIGIELTEKSIEYINALMKEGVLSLAAGPMVIRLLPPLVITYEEIDFVIEKLHKVLSD